MDLLQYYVNFQSSLTTVTDCDSLIRGDQGPPNFCLHRVARMLRPALGWWDTREGWEKVGWVMGRGMERLEGEGNGKGVEGKGRGGKENEGTGRGKWTAL